MHGNNFLQGHKILLDFRRFIDADKCTCRKEITKFIPIYRILKKIFIPCLGRYDNIANQNVCFHY